MELIGTCVRHIKVLGPNRHTPYQEDVTYASNITAFVSSQEADLFIPEAKFLKKFIMEAKRNRGITSIVKAHCHYASEKVEDGDKSQSQELFNVVEHGLNEYDYNEVRPFFCLFEIMLETDHENFTNNRERWLGKFLEIVGNNT
jgi:hypothetical protein